MINRFQCKGQDVAFTVCFKRVFLFIDTNLLIYLAMNHSVLLFNATAACLIIFHIWVFWVRRHFRHRENINCISFVRVEFFVSTWCRKATQKSCYIYSQITLCCAQFLSHTHSSLWRSLCVFPSVSCDILPCYAVILIVYCMATRG